MKPEESFQVQEFKLFDITIFQRRRKLDFWKVKNFSRFNFSSLLEENFATSLLLFHAASHRVALCTHVRVSNLCCQRNTPKCFASLSSQRSSSRPIFGNDRSGNFALSHFRFATASSVSGTISTRSSHYIFFSFPPFQCLEIFHRKTFTRLQT